MKIGIITGANSGLGYASTQKLLKEGYYIYMACRSEEKTLEAIKSFDPQLRAQVEYVHCDLSSFDSIRECATYVLNKEKQLNVLMLNAGLMATPPSETKEGYEMQIGVNVLGHALLADLLVPLIKTTPDARVISLSSVASNSGRPLQKQMLKLTKEYRPWQSYSNSKLGDVYYAKALAQYFREQDIDALSIAAHPGGTASQLQINTRKMGGVGISGPFWVYVMKFFGMTIHQGALSQLMGVLSSEVKNGDYIGPKGSGSAFKGNPKVIENYSVSQSELDDFRTLLKTELGLEHF
ncbi:SDR family NAD(P)-dependent oxidoreductase [bacterium]|jgi:NAD(P)-dependent dehydrogenase (short-subunit alcohol dehydrogenase family)|nr:SDR family NAD(P)-dependent oxidoreductase [Candidatus Actinomarina sp.]MDA9681512.1 SDR family NAD(P)-dependent oxidoreductase [bacterium]